MIGTVYTDEYTKTAVTQASIFTAALGSFFLGNAYFGGAIDTQTAVPAQVYTDLYY